MAITLSLAVAGCGSTAGDEPSSDDGSGASVTVANGDKPSPISVDEALGQPEGSSLLVTGYLFGDSGLVFIADLVAESFPPQPGGAVMDVTGIDLGEVDGVSQQGPILWLDEPQTVSGTVTDNQLAEARIVEPDAGD